MSTMFSEKWVIHFNLVLASRLEVDVNTFVKSPSMHLLYLVLVVLEMEVGVQVRHPVQ